MLSNTSKVDEELERILKSRWLRESHQLSSLLSHIVEETSAGRGDGLKEYALGLAVFHRPKDYDPRNDAIVRVQASLLRKRLASYYENEGMHAGLRIQIPRGKYVAEFVEVTAPEPIAAELLKQSGWGNFIAGVAMGALLVAAVSWYVHRPEPVQARSLWGAFLRPEVETIASFGVPLFYSGGSGLYVRDVEINEPDEEFRQGRIGWVGETLKLKLRPQEDVYTGVGDAIGTDLIARWLEKHGVKVGVANSNYLGPSDIKGKNLIVVASARFQTLLQRMNLEQRYHFTRNKSLGGYTIDNPMPGEQQGYYQSTGLGVSVDYGILSLWPSDGDKRILYLSGSNTWTTQGAAQFAVDAEKLADLQKRLDADPPDGPRGKKSPYFQVLLQMEGKNNRVRSVTYVSHRYLRGT